MNDYLPGIVDVVYDGKWIEIVRCDDGRFYEVIAKRQEKVAATIEWYPRWRKWVFAPRDNTVWDNYCMGEICGFMGTLRKR